MNYHETSLKVGFNALPPGLTPNEAAHVPIRDRVLRYTSHDVVTDAQPGLSEAHGQLTAVTTVRETLRVRLEDPAQPFAVTLCHRLTPEYDIIETWCVLENNGFVAVNLESCAFATMHVQNGTSELTSMTGAWVREFTQQRERLPMGLRIL